MRLEEESDGSFLQESLSNLILTSGLVERIYDVAVLVLGKDSQVHLAYKFLIHI